MRDALPRRAVECHTRPMPKGPQGQKIRQRHGRPQPARRESCGRLRKICTIAIFRKSSVSFDLYGSRRVMDMQCVFTGGKMGYLSKRQRRERAVEFRQLAEGAERLAGIMTLSENRAAFVRLALHWLSCAREVENARWTDPEAYRALAELHLLEGCFLIFRVGRHWNC